MEQNKNIFLRRVPERLSNIVKGLFFVVISIPLTFFAYFFTILVPNGGIFVGDVPHPNSWIQPLATIIGGIAFLAPFIYGLYLMVRPVKSE